MEAGVIGVNSKNVSFIAKAKELKREVEIAPIHNQNIMEHLASDRQLKKDFAMNILKDI
jgi:hypothetical protein